MQKRWAWSDRFIVEYTRYKWEFYHWCADVLLYAVRWFRRDVKEPSDDL